MLRVGGVENAAEKGAPRDEAERDTIETRVASNLISAAR